MWLKNAWTSMMKKIAMCLGLMSVGIVLFGVCAYAGLKHKDVVTIECLGAGAVSGQDKNVWLNGITGDGRVSLAPTTTGQYTGTKWEVSEIEDGVYTFKCLGAGAVSGQDKNMWLNGITGDGKVGLAPTTTGQYTGTNWRIHKVAQ